MKRSSTRLIALTIFTVVVLALILMATWFASDKINKNAEEQCFDELHDETYEMGKEIEQKVEASTRQLELVATLAAGHEDLTDGSFWSEANSYIASSQFSRVELLLPGDELIIRGGEVVDVSGKLSYEEEAALGSHISGRMDDEIGNSGQILRQYVPVKRSGKTVAMLCGIVELKNMARQLIDKPYGGDAAAYIIDRTTGDFLLDTWHDELGNIWSLGSRKMAEGYDDSLLKQGMAEGKSDYVVFVSQTTGSYLYFYYMPINVEHWSVALSVPEDVVFAQAQYTHNVLDIFLRVEICCFVAYLVGILCYVRFELREKQRKLDMLNRVYDVERLLFNAHEDQDLVSAALEQTAGILEAEQVAYWMMPQTGYDILYTWYKPDCAIRQEEFAVQRRNAASIIKYLKDTGEEYCDKTEAIADAYSRGIYSQLAVPVRDLDGELNGVLLALNLSVNDENIAMLRGLEVSFGLFCRNMLTYQSVKEQSERDALTGLYNRSRYMQDAADCSGWYTGALACVYVDANGLHELNNSRGHSAGDRMLQAVAEAMKKHFGEEHTYRIGGDEFLAFVADRPVAEIQRLADECAAQVNGEGYDIAVGVEMAQHVSDTRLLVEAAEKRMYAAKHDYYAQRRRRAAR